MKFGLRYNRKVNMMLMYMVLIFSIISLAIYPSSRSKYVHAEQGVLKYDATLYYQKNLTIKLLGDPYEDTPPEVEYQSTYETAYFQFDFKRNASIGSTGEDDYTIRIEPSNACTIVNLVANQEATISEDKKQIHYANAGVDNITGILECSVEKITKVVNQQDVISVTVSVDEKVEDKEFLYAQGTYTEPLQEYYEKYPIPKEDVEELDWTWTTLTLPDNLSDEFYEDIGTYIEKIDPALLDYLPKNFFDDFEISKNSLYAILTEIWLDNIVGKYNGNEDANYKYSAYYEEIKSYITKTLNENNAFDVTNEINLPGLKISHEKTNGGYIHKFEIEENLIGYARTDADIGNQKWMYFYTEDAEAIDKSFNEYVNKYTYLEDKQLLKDYINSYSPNNQNGMSYILKNGSVQSNLSILLHGKTVAGINYNGNEKRISFTPNLLDYASIKIHRRIEIVPGNSVYMLLSYQYGLREIYGKSVSEKTIETYGYYTSDIGKSVVHNHETKQPEYFIVYEPGDTAKGIPSNYLVFIISSDANKTYVDILDSEINGNILNVHMSSTNTTELLNIVQLLDNYFEVATLENPLHQTVGDLVNDTYLKVVDNGNTKNITYSIPLEKIKLPFNTMIKMLIDLKAELRNSYSDVVSEETINKYFDYTTGHLTDIARKVVTNTSINGKTEVYHETYEFRDETYPWNLLFTIYSDGKNTYVTVDKIEVSTNNIIETEDVVIKENKVVDKSIEVATSSASLIEETNVSSSEVMDTLQEFDNVSKEEEKDSKESFIEDTKENDVSDIEVVEDTTNKDTLLDTDVDKTSEEDTKQSSNITDTSFEEVESPLEAEVEVPDVPSGTTSGIESISDTALSVDLL